MAGPPPNVPLPLDDDHEDVAWALRAASAQWRRGAQEDAVHWLKRAAETAEEVGAALRARELQALAAQLRSTPNAPSPPVPSVSAVPSSGRTSEPISLEFDEVEVELDDEEVEVFVDDVEMLDEVEELEEVDGSREAEGRVEGEPESSSIPSAFPSDVSGLGSPRASGIPNRGAPPSSQELDVRPARRTTTAPKIDMLPPSMRPEPSGLDLDDEAEVEAGAALSADSGDDEVTEFGELDLSAEVLTARGSSSSLPPVSEISEFSMGAAADVPLDGETAAEYAQSKMQVPAESESAHDLEKELGVNLSVRSGPLSREASRLKWEAQARLNRAVDSAMSEPEFEGHSELRPPSLSSLPSGALDEPSSSGSSQHSPVPGRASVHPTQLPFGTPRVTSAEREPYGMAPSAELPPQESIPAPPIEPPSRPLTAPPPERMSEPEERPSTLPAVDSSTAVWESPPSSAAPDAEEFEELFAQLSQRPEAYDIPSVAPGSELQDVEAPLPPDVATAEAERAAVVGTGGPQLKPDGAPQNGAVVDGVDLLEVVGFQDLPPDAAQEMAAAAIIKRLEPHEELSTFAVALVTRGAVRLMPTVVDATCRIARKGEVLFTQGTIAESAHVRIVGLEADSRVAIFSRDELERATSSCPWVADELAEVADRHLAFAGAVLGPLGDSLDEMFRFMVLDKCSVKSKAEGVRIAEGGKPMNGMYVVGAGSVELLDDAGHVTETLSMGDFVFPETVLTAGPASQSVRIGAGGALLLYADRMAAHELLATCPPLIELLAG